MKGLADNHSYIVELLEGGATLENVIDGHICEQALVSSAAQPLNVLRLKCKRFPKCLKWLSCTVFSTLWFGQLLFALCAALTTSCVPRWRRVRLWWVTSVPWWGSMCAGRVRCPGSSPTTQSSATAAQQSSRCWPLWAWASFVLTRWALNITDSNSGSSVCL